MSVISQRYVSVYAQPLSNPDAHQGEKAAKVYMQIEKITPTPAQSAFKRAKIS